MRRISLFDHFTAIIYEIQSESIRLTSGTYWVPRSPLSNNSESTLIRDFVKRGTLSLKRKSDFSREEQRKLQLPGYMGARRIYRVEKEEEIERWSKNPPRITTMNDWRAFLNPNENGVPDYLKGDAENIIVKCRANPREGRKDFDRVMQLFRKVRHTI